MNNRNKYTLITGGSSGIGLELAKIAAKDGRNILLIARDKAGLEKAVNIIQEANHSRKLLVETLAVDLSANNAATKIKKHCLEKGYFVNELINNAGFGDYGAFAQSKLSVQLSMIDVNIRSLTELTHLFLPEMIASKNGRIMNLGSLASFLPGPNMSVYFASKNYVLRFSEALADELRSTGVTVTCLCPGPTKTGFGKNAHVGEKHSTANPKTTATEVASFGWYHMQRGQKIAIYGLGNKLSVQAVRILPRRLVAILVRKLQG